MSYLFSNKDVVEIALSRFGLSLNQEVNVPEVWDLFIERGEYKHIICFLGISVDELPEALIGGPGFAEEIFGATKNMSTKHQKKFQGKYRIASAVITNFCTSHNSDKSPTFRITVYVNYILKDGSWSKRKLTLFNYICPGDEETNS